MKLPEKIGERPRTFRNAAFYYGLPTLGSIVYAIIERTVFWTEVVSIAASIAGALFGAPTLETKVASSPPEQIARAEPAPPPVSTCTGGTVSTEGSNRVHTFTSTGTLECAGSSVSTSAVIAIGGGGGGGGGGTSASSSGGGGSNGYVIVSYGPTTGISASNTGTTTYSGSAGGGGIRP